MIPEHADVMLVPGGTGDSLVRGVVGGTRVKVHPVSKLRSVCKASSSLVSESKANQLQSKSEQTKSWQTEGGPKVGGDSSKHDGGEQIKQASQ